MAIVTLSGACARVDASRSAVQVDMAHVDLHVSSDVTLHIDQLRGSFVPVQREAPDLDDKRSYVVAVDSGRLAIDLPSLNVLMAQAMSGDKSNLEKLRLSIENGKLRQQGVIDSAIDLPFKSDSEVSATADGRIRVSTRAVRGFGVSLKPVMKLFGLRMDNLVKVKKGAGVEVIGNDLIVDPALLIPAPAIRGQLTSVRIEGQRMVQTFGSPPGTALASRPLSPNHIYWRGGQLVFGRLTMNETDLELVDTDASDPFDFSVDNWNGQLVAGYSKTQADGALKAFVPDYNDLKKAGVRLKASGARPATDGSGGQAAADK